VTHIQETRLAAILDSHRDSLLTKWLQELSKNRTGGRERITEAEQREQCREFIQFLGDGLKSGSTDNLQSQPWAPLRELLSSVSTTRARQGFTASETVAFIFSVKQPLFEQIGNEIQNDNATLIAEISIATRLLDQLGLYTSDQFLKVREEVIIRQQEEMLELSTPVVKLWDGILALPIIGTLDSSRAQVVMENLLQAIVDTGSDVAIIDITGVPTVDTLVSQHLLKTVAAARLMGADCIISGIRPQIAQTIVHLGVDLGQVTTKATLADAFTLALKRVGASIVRTKA